MDYLELQNAFRYDEVRVGLERPARPSTVPGRWPSAGRVRIDDAMLELWPEALKLAFDTTRERRCPAVA